MHAVAPDAELLEELDEIFSNKENLHKFPALVRFYDARIRIYHDKRNGTDTVERRRAYHKKAGLYPHSNGKKKLQELSAYKQFERSSGFRHTVLMMLRRYGIEVDNDKETLDNVRLAKIDLYARSMSSYYRARSETNLSFMVPPKTFPTVRSKYAAIHQLAGMVNENPKRLEREYELHNGSVLMWPRFHAYLKQVLGTSSVK